jgi:3-oxoacyl-(acyl-carrier-protein) synthase/acyl carrier protein/NAD(P)-dependent dehydrogenase (short-subunit alcohol dehydrogenase family)
LLKKIDAYESFIDEYCYTDVSRAFLNHAEIHYAPEHKYLKTRLLNIEASPLGQGFDPGSYDIIVAAQVLHATESISRTLSNVKVLLKRNGLLILNELSERSVFSHLTFGMLEGWWLYKDASVRMPFSPGLFSDSWEHCLTGQGFSEVYFPVPESHVMRQQIVIASSDGYNRVDNKTKPDFQDGSTTMVGDADKLIAGKEDVVAKISSIRECSNDALLEYIKTTITSALSDALKVPVEAIDPQETFSEYGLDSITGVGVAQKISSLLDIELNTTVLFDYVSVEQLADHIMKLSPTLPSEPEIVADKSDSSLKPSAEKETPADDMSSEPESSNDAVFEYIKTTITSALSDALKVPVDAIDPQETFSEYGLDSITGVGVAQKISSLLDIELNTTVLFDYVSVEQLADHIMKLSPTLPSEPEIVADKSGSSSETTAESGSDNSEEAIVNLQSQSSASDSYVAASDSYSSESIAVIGMSGRFPGSDNVEELWENICNGVDLITPLKRWDMSRCKNLSDEFCAQGGFLSGIGQFDPGFFNISGTEATYMDPQQRLFLQEAWKALEDAGYAGDTSFTDKAGVYVGCNSGDYKNIISEDAPAQAFWGNAASITPARISYHLNLNGPAMAVDTACSSSLVAIHLACQGLWSGELNVALAGGVFVQSTPEFYVSADKAGMLSRRGRCQAFDSSADGFVPSEGVGVLVLKRLTDALADGDHIHGVIKGSGINQDGASNGITAPSALSQQKLIAGVYSRFSIEPGDIQLVEAHGTGTSLGDPIESEGLKASYHRAQSSSTGSVTTKTCALGSIKSNMGHAITAAGVASVIKVLMSLKNRQFPPTINFNELNPKIDFTDTPFYINTRLVDWDQPENSRRMAAVSSFGFSGTNGHLVLEEAPLAEKVTCERPMYLFALSARSEDQLKSMAESLIGHCQDGDIDVAGTSFTLLNGRRHCDYRLAFVAGSKNEMIRALKRYVQGEDDQGYISGYFDKKAFVKRISLQTYAEECISRYRKEVSPETCHELLSVIADLYIQGYSIPFKDLFSISECRRVSLPTYPFSKREYWVSPVDKPDLDKYDNEELPLQWMLTKTAYEPCPFGDIEDWSTLVRALEGKIIYVLGEKTQTNELKTLIDQLCVKASLNDHPSVESMTYENAISVQELDVLPDYILCIDTLGKRDREQLAGLQALFQLLKCTMQANWNKPVDTYYIYNNHEAGNGVYPEAMSGFYESIAQENDLYTFTLIQYDQENQQQTQLQSLLLDVLQDDGLKKAVEKIQYRNNERFVERHIEYTGREDLYADLHQNANITLQAGKTYLITGGFGPVGRQLCEYLVKHYDSNLIILSRSPINDDKNEICNQLNENAGNIYYYSVDICDRHALDQTLDSVREEIGPINGVIHMARMVHDNLLVAKSWNEFSTTIEAKVWGTVNLDECLAQEPLDFFVLFSSIAAFGLRGASDYGYSAAFQNSYARYRNSLLESGLRSGVTVSQCWAGWTVDRYMPDARMDIIKENGMQPITINEAMKMFSESLCLNESVIGLIGVTDRTKARKFFHIDQPVTIQMDNLDSKDLDELLSDWLSKKDSMTEHEQIEMKESAVRLLTRFDVDLLSNSVVKKVYSLMFADEVQPKMNVSPIKNDQYKHNKDDEVDIRSIVFETIKKALLVDDLVLNEKLQHYGMDSVSAMQISSRLSNRLGVSIEPIWLLDNPTIDLFSNYLESKFEDLTLKSEIRTN